MPNLTVSALVDNLMQSADAPAARVVLGLNTKADFNTACTDNDFAFLTGGNLYTGLQNMGDLRVTNSVDFQGTSVTMDSDAVANFRSALQLTTMAQFDAACSDGNFAWSGNPANFTNLTLTGTLGVSGQITATAGISSTSTTTGSLVVTGGVGVSGDIYSANLMPSAHTVGTIGTSGVRWNSIYASNEIGALNFIGSGFYSRSNSGSINLGVLDDIRIVRDGPASLQLGVNSGTNTINQSIKAHDVTTGTGAGLVLAGGKGSVAGGPVSLATSATNGALVNRLTVAADGKVSATAIPTYANDAAADADATLVSGGFYKITGSRTLYQKP